MRLVELIPALQTDQDTMTRARAFAEACGKEVTVSKDVPGCESHDAASCPCLQCWLT